MLPAAIPTAEDPPASTQLSEDLQGAAQFDHIRLPATQRTVEATVLGVVQYASSNSSEESCGAYFDRQVALIEGVLPQGLLLRPTKLSPKKV